MGCRWAPEQRWSIPAQTAWGERTGNAALEELVLALDLLYGTATGCDIGALKTLSSLVAERSGVPVARNKPVVGEENFTRESGIGVNLVVEKPLAMFAIHPRLGGIPGHREANPSLRIPPG